jgi:hypothetical protein
MFQFILRRQNVKQLMASGIDSQESIPRWIAIEAGIIVLSELVFYQVWGHS